MARGMILQTMLQRLYAGLVNGPSMNARPHRSRQRCDFMEFIAFRSAEPVHTLRTLLEKGKADIAAKVPRPPEDDKETDDALSAAASKSKSPERLAYLAQARLLKKLRDISADATDYINDHGESCLALGFPLLSLPAGAEEVSGRSARVLAPLLLMPLDVQVRTASRPGVTLAAAANGADLVVPNPALIAWLERVTGRTVSEIFTDDEGADPWREVQELLAQISALTGMETPTVFTADSLLQPVPLTEELPKNAAVLPCAVLGLFPLSNQSLLRDTRWMQENEAALREPVRAFLSPLALEKDNDAPAPADTTVQPRNFADEWLVSPADPCQAGAVLAARDARTLIVHGPPGTGKSQTITNMIADHLARRQRVLFVCDKRTALDVVKFRLDSTGLGDLCGVIHDPGADRKEFYMGLREQLETLASTPVPADPQATLERVNAQLAAAHSELEACRQKLHGIPTGTARSFHELLGVWMELSARAGLLALKDAEGITAAMLEAASTTLEEITRRAATAGYAANPLRGLVTDDVSAVLSRTSVQVRQTFQEIADWAVAADALACGTLAPDFAVQSTLLRAAVKALKELAAQTYPADPLLRWALTLPEHSRRSFFAETAAACTQHGTLLGAPLERSMLASARSAGMPTLATVNQRLQALADWDAVSGSFFKSLFSGSRKASAGAALAPVGLSLPSGTAAARTFYEGLKSRLLLADLLSGITGAAAGLPEDEELERMLQSARLACAALAAWESVAAASRPDVSPAEGFCGSAARETIDNLEARAAWADALVQLQTLLTVGGVFHFSAFSGLAAKWAAGEGAAPAARAWLDHSATLEDMVRTGAALEQLPRALRQPVESLIAGGADAALMRDSLSKTATENEIRARIDSDPALRAMDGDRIGATFEALMSLSAQKQELARSSIRHTWLTLQRERLLSGTGTQLGRAGAALRQRLFVKGKRALKLRQMLATGEGAEGGDPVFDLCPVWMASPSTVAQIFPRAPIFDVVIFDEASQCRLEEALPVLLRGQRVVIAGDQKQLPPTRFFESALSDSGDIDAETAEELFYQQQSEAEDLLTAALNLDAHEAYLDVHYRSRHEGLIGFSNKHYYGSRLQPIPGYPSARAASPITLHCVDGIYEDRANEKEAAAAVELAAKLLAGDAPPSIGIACFNLTQRDAILDAMAAKCEADVVFAERLEAARQRRGRDSFEGLFVKNLENVQGDERDVMIICTTFGPDPAGKFRRNFGALAQAGGERRLNVLITRARTAIHLLTSIPAAEYRAIEAAPAGVIPGGRLQLYAYLRHTESLANNADLGTAPAAAGVTVHRTATPSRLAAAFGRRLQSQHGAANEVHWGNEGFCVDLVCCHPHQPGGVTVGVLTDFTRFHKTPDPVEWDLFRTSVLRRQGWHLHRLWSPVLFRRAEESLAAIAQAHTAAASGSGASS